jgi:putative tryptophan/tyrosine transport system substrate-binding protein
VRAETATIPIVSAGGGDLIATGLAASYARPGGNVTGVSNPALAGKQFQLLQETVPGLARIAVLFDTTNPIRREIFEAAAPALDLQVQFVGVGGSEELMTAFETATRGHADGLFVFLGPRISDNLTRIAELAIQRQFPSMWAQTEAVERGGLMAYGANRAALYRRAAYYVDRILKGTQPAELPIEQPREFEFIINLKTAQALGLTIPPPVLLQATEVLQ